MPVEAVFSIRIAKPMYFKGGIPNRAWETRGPPDRPGEMLEPVLLQTKVQDFRQKAHPREQRLKQQDEEALTVQGQKNWLTSVKEGREAVFGRRPN